MQTSSRGPIAWNDESLFNAPLHDLASIKRIAERYGFCVVKGIFTRSDLDKIVAGMRASPLRHVDAAEPDLLSLPELRWLLTDERVLSIAHTLLGPQLVYYGETAANFEETIGNYTLKPLMQLHADAMGTAKDLIEYFKPRQSDARHIYPVYRFAVYLHDYKNYSGGLKVVPESHLYDHDQLVADATQEHEVPIAPNIAIKTATRNYGFYNVASQPGDLVLWNLHTLHSAGAIRLIDHPNLALPPDAEEQLWLKEPQTYHPIPGPRVAAFFDFAHESEEVDLYIKSRAMFKAKSLSSPTYKTWCYDQHELKSLMSNLNVKLRYDAMILSLALHLIHVVNKAKGEISTLVRPETIDLTNRLVALCRANHEYSPHFPLFDPALLASPTTDTNQIVAVLDSIYSFCLRSGLLKSM